MYRYDEFDDRFVRERVAQFRDQVERRLAGKLTEEEFRPLRLMNGLYLQLHAYMLRVAIPYGTLSSDQLRKLAEARMRNESPDHTLDATGLVHEAYIRLIGSADPGWQNRAHFFAAAAEAMRRVLIDRARTKRAARHGAGWERVDLETIDAPTQAGEEMLFRVNEALEDLSREDDKAAEIVKLRFFTGMTVEEAGLALGVTERTARRYWRFARAWLHDRLQPGV
jgi:RNA polymerase sigma factor (TIGR02999 family)